MRPAAGGHFDTKSGTPGSTTLTTHLRTTRYQLQKSYPKGSEELDDPVKDESIHFTERSLRYEALNVNLEEASLGEYGTSTKNMAADESRKNGDETASFFAGFKRRLPLPSKIQVAQSQTIG